MGNWRNMGKKAKHNLKHGLEKHSLAFETGLMAFKNEGGVAWIFTAQLYKDK